MDYKQEQANEVEALQCIFIDEFELVYSEPYRFELTIHTDWDESDLNFISLKLVSYSHIRL